MIKKPITYNNPFTDQPVTEDHYFHLGKSAFVEMQMESLKEPPVFDPANGQKLEGFQAKMQRIINDEDGKEILVIVKDIVRRAYGKKDGDRFLRSPEIWANFESSEAWGSLYFELCTDAEALATFINGILPKELVTEVNAIIEARKETEPSPETGGNPIPDEIVGVDRGETAEDRPRLLTQVEVAGMDSDELKSGLATGRYKLSP